MNGTVCPNCGSALFVGDDGTVCPSCGWKKKPDSAEADVWGSAKKTRPSRARGGGEPSRKGAFGSSIRAAERDSAGSEALGAAAKESGARMVEFHVEMRWEFAASISLGVGFLVAILWFFGMFIKAYVPVLAFQVLMPIIVVPICWFFGGAFLDAKKRIRAAFVCALAFSLAYAYTGWGIFVLVREAEQMAVGTAAVYAFVWCVSFAIAGTILARAVGWFAAAASAGPGFLFVAGVLGVAVGLGMELGFAHLFGGMLYGYIPPALTMAGLLLGAAQTGMERGW